MKTTLGSMSLLVMMMVQSASAAQPEARRLLVAIEGGGAFELNARTGAIVSKFETGPDAFGALYSTDGRRAFVTDKADGTLLELAPGSKRIVNRLVVGKTPQQPALASDGRLFIPLSGEAAVAVVDVRGTPVLLRKISIGAETKPHIVALSPDQRTLYVTVQGKDPKVVALAITSEGEALAKEYRYDLVPRVVAASNEGAYYTAHHSTGLHFANLSTGAASTVYMDVNGDASEPRKQIEGIAVSEDGGTLGITHEGRKALVTLQKSSGSIRKICDISPLSDKPYWVTLDSSNEIAFVSIPGSGTVEAYDIVQCSSQPLWTTLVGGKPKRMAVTNN